MFLKSHLILILLEIALHAVSWVGAFLILGTNTVAAKTVVNLLKKSFINWLICLDCLIGICVAVLLFAKPFDALFFGSSLEFCTFNAISSYFLSMMNGLLPISILLFRLTHVYWSNRIMTRNQRRALSGIICVFTFGVTIFLTAGVFFYKEHYKPYQQCVGQVVDSSNFFDLPNLHPLRLTTIMVFFIRSFFVPIGYICIFYFTERTAKNAPGLSETSRIKRRAQNAVNAKFNCYIWMAEMLSFAVLIFNDPFSARIYLVLSFGVSPILYLVGMEESRLELLHFLMNLLRG